MSGGGKPKRGGMSDKIVNELSGDNLAELKKQYDELIHEYESCKSQISNNEREINSLHSRINQVSYSETQFVSENLRYENLLRADEEQLSILKEDFLKQKSDSDKGSKIVKEIENLKTEINRNLEESEEPRRRLEKINDEISKIGGSELKGV